MGPALAANGTGESAVGDVMGEVVMSESMKWTAEGEVGSPVRNDFRVPSCGLSTVVDVPDPR
jgi:hypothetical protein